MSSSKTEFIAFRVSAKELAELKAFAKAEGVSLSEAVRSSHKRALLGPRSKQVLIRLTVAEYRMLEEIVKATGLYPSDVFRLSCARNTLSA